MAGRTPLRLLVGSIAALLLGSGCSRPPAVPVQPPAQGAATTGAPTARPAAPGAATPATPPAAAAPTERAARNWDEYRQRAAERIMLVNRAATYSGKVPEPLLAIPVLEVELRGDGSVQRIQVLRQPRQALDTVQLATDAVRRAAPFGSVTHLPRPWKFTETFLFADDRRFKLRSQEP